MKDKIIEILKSNSKDGWNGNHSCVGEIDFEKVAEELVKLLPISNVSQQSEQICDSCSCTVEHLEDGLCSDCYADEML